MAKIKSKDPKSNVSKSKAKSKLKNKGMKLQKKHSTQQKSDESLNLESIDEIEKLYDELQEEDFEDFEDDEEIESKSKCKGDKNNDIYNDKDFFGDEEIEDNDYDDAEDEGSDDDEEAKGSDYNDISEQSLKKLEEELMVNGTAVAAFKKFQNILSATVASIIGSEDKKHKGHFEVKEPHIFNQIVRICLNRIPQTLHRLFELKTLSDKPVRNKKWTLLSSSIKKYLKNIILLFKSFSEPTMIEKILKKGTLPLLPFYAEFANLSWLLTKQIVIFWSTSQEKVRVLSVIALFRLITSFKEEIKEKVFKLLYVSYVQNCRFTSPTSWPMIDFMRMSLAELYVMDQSLAYRHGFIYIRQLASHLRNAMLIQKKERTQLVYNWQFVHCLHFWSELLAKTHPSAILKPLIYPIVQISHGVLTLMKSPTYYPLIFHISNILTELSDKTDIFIPVLPYLMEVLSSQRLRKNPHKKSAKPLEWNCIIKVSKSQLDESAFSNGLLDQIFNSSIKYLNSQSNSIGFPELVFPFTLQLKTFLKKCKIPNHTRKIKQLLDKMNENAQYIDNHRKNVPFKITNSEAIRNWEIEIGQNIPPFRAFYNQWTEMSKNLKKRQRTEEEREVVDEQEDGAPSPKKKRFKKSKVNKDNSFRKKNKKIVKKK